MLSLFRRIIIIISIVFLKPPPLSNQRDKKARDASHLIYYLLYHYRGEKKNEVIEKIKITVMLRYEREKKNIIKQRKDTFTEGATNTPIPVLHQNPQPSLTISNSSHPSPSCHPARLRAARVNRRLLPSLRPFLLSHLSVLLAFHPSSLLSTCLSEATWLSSNVQV